MKTSAMLRVIEGAFFALPLLAGCSSDTSGSPQAQAPQVNAAQPSTSPVATPAASPPATVAPPSNPTPAASAVAGMSSSAAVAPASQTTPVSAPVAPSAPAPAPPAPAQPDPAAAPVAESPIASFVKDGSWQLDCAASPPKKPECSMPFSDGNAWSFEKVLKLTRQHVIDMWSSAPAVPVGELSGAYIGLGPNAGDASAKSDIDNRLFNDNGPLGYWLGKTYKAADPGQTKSEGYNRWRHGGDQVMRSMRFATEPGMSLIDSKPAFMMFYSAFSPSNTLTDELRKIAPHVYIGLATMRSGNGRTSPDHFVLVGPAGPWQPFE